MSAPLFCLVVSSSWSEASSVACSWEEQHMLHNTMTGASLSACSEAPVFSLAPRRVTQPFSSLPPPNSFPFFAELHNSCSSSVTLPHEPLSRVEHSVCLCSYEGPGCLDWGSLIWRHLLANCRGLWWLTKSHLTFWRVIMWPRISNADVFFHLSLSLSTILHPSVFANLSRAHDSVNIKHECFTWSCWKLSAGKRDYFLEQHDRHIAS